MPACGYRHEATAQIVRPDITAIRPREISPGVARVGMDLQDIATAAADFVTQASPRLVEIEAEIRAAQPPRDGAVLMYLYRHQQPCMGCPHVTWKQWRSHPRRAVYRWSAHRLQTPLRHLPHSKDYADLRLLVIEALALERRRTTLVKHLSALARALAALPETHP